MSGEWIPDIYVIQQLDYEKRKKSFKLNSEKVKEGFSQYPLMKKVMPVTQKNLHVFVPAA